MAQNITDHQLALCTARRRQHLFGLCNGFGQRFFQKHMRTRLERLTGIIRMAIRPGVDRHCIGFEHAERTGIIIETRIIGQFSRQLGLRRQVATAQTHNLEPVQAMIRLGMRNTHIAHANDEYTYLIGHVHLFDVIAKRLSYLCRTGQVANAAVAGVRL